MSENTRYNEEDIKAMSGSEVILLLYDEAIGRLKSAEQSLKDKNYDSFDDCLSRVSRIIRYLKDILDMDYSVSSDLRRIYEYLVYDISAVKAGKESRQEEIGRICHILSELREGFEGAGRQVNEECARKETDERIQ